MNTISRITAGPNNLSCILTMLAIGMTIGVPFQLPLNSILRAAMPTVQEDGQENDSVVQQTLARIRQLQTPEQISGTLTSVRKIHDHPLYTMTFRGSYEVTPIENSAFDLANKPRWGCSLFFTGANRDQPLFGRNFDWNYEPALLIFTNPPGGFASASMVDISYLGYTHENLDDLETNEGRSQLLMAPQIPFDGINEHGLTIGMAAVDDTEVPDSPERPNVYSVQIIRMMLDRCRTTAEAVKLFAEFDIVFRGPNIHYLIADPSGDSALVEIKDGKVHVHHSKDTRWQVATNHYLTGLDKLTGHCHRFDCIQSDMRQSGGKLSIRSAMELLKDVSQQSTQWSIIYDLKARQVNVAMSRTFDKPLRFQFDGKQVPNSDASDVGSE